jgi:PAS domain-containing protein
MSGNAGALTLLLREGQRLPRTPWESAARYGVAVLTVVLAGGFTLLLAPVAEGAPFLFFFAAVMLSAWYGGLRPALLTAALSAAWSAYFVLPPLFSLAVDTPGGALRLGLFLLVAFLISSLQARRQQAETIERIQREYFQTTLASIGDAVIVTDSQGRVTLMNRVAQALTGWTLEEAEGRALSEVFAIFNEETRQPDRRTAGL